MRYFAALLLCCSLTGLQAQNLVYNPSFEILDTNHLPLPCRYAKTAGRFTLAVKGWTAFRGLTPDIITWQPNLSHCAYPAPHTGSALVGLILFHPSEDSGQSRDYHEFIQGLLKTPLQPDSTYQIEFWIQQRDTTAIHHLQSVFGKKTNIYPVASNNLGFLFLESASLTDEDIRNSIEVLRLQPHFEVTDIIRTEDGEWKKISGTFTPKRPYKYFMIGNFRTAQKTDIYPDDNREKVDDYNQKEGHFYNKIKRIAYYCIDDIAIYPASTSEPKPALSLSKARPEHVEGGDRYVFQAVHFLSGQANLLPEALPELNGLVEWLKLNTDKKLEIGGHTDHVGNLERNRLLSEQRAQAVYNYLVDQGIPEYQLTYRGYGETEPIAGNETEAGRRRNRRVECRVVE